MNRTCRAACLLVTVTTLSTPVFAGQAKPTPIADSIKTHAAQISLGPQTGQGAGIGSARRAPSLMALLIGAGAGCGIAAAGAASFASAVGEGPAPAGFVVKACAGGAIVGTVIGYGLSTR